MAEPHPPTRQGGFVTAQFVVVVGLSLLFFTMMANVIVFMYGRGVVRAALEEGVRAASPAAATSAICQREADETMRSLLGGSMGREIRIECEIRGGEVHALASGRFRGWLPGMPDWRFTQQATAVKEQLP
jgi:hypothetical protein